MRRHLVIFTRLPRLGQGKRRLAAHVGPVEAWRLQCLRLTALLRRLGRDRRWKTWLAVTPDRSGPWPPALGRMGQGRGDLGRRMARVARSMPPGPAVIVGSDIPDLTASHVAEAFVGLGNHDAVFGPAADGGFWLVGLCRRPCFRDPFAGVRWSTRHALADTLANLAGMRVAMLETLDDLDDGEALARFRAR
jgi:rSAM/selenodomain-associated transferase 1